MCYSRGFPDGPEDIEDIDLEDNSRKFWGTDCESARSPYTGLKRCHLCFQAPQSAVTKSATLQLLWYRITCAQAPAACHSDI